MRGGFLSSWSRRATRLGGGGAESGGKDTSICPLAVSRLCSLSLHYFSLVPERGRVTAQHSTAQRDMSDIDDDYADSVDEEWLEIGKEAASRFLLSFITSTTR